MSGGDRLETRLLLREGLATNGRSACELGSLTITLPACSRGGYASNAAKLIKTKGEGSQH